MSTGIIILAAGESVRMGEPKQLLAYRGGTLLHHAIETALTLPGAPITVVLGAHAARIRAQLGDSRVSITENPDWRTGLGGSIRAGLSALLAAHPGIAAAIFLLCDQPLVSASHLGNLVAMHARTGRAIVSSEYGGALGVPALFSRTLFPELLALHGTDGARQIIQTHPDQAIGVTFQEGAVDIDTPADYARLRSSLNDVPALAPV
jgi:molybdenum cofactor cytidylyltransferase